MSITSPYEVQLLRPVEALLQELAGTGAGAHDQRLEVLEAVASRLGGFSLPEYRRVFPARFQMDSKAATSAATAVASIMGTIPMHPALALSALARPPATEADRRTAGAYYTDFRLAQLLAANAAPHLVRGARIIDPASGTGALLVAAVLSGCGPDRVRTASWLRRQVFGADLSAPSVRGARLALSALTDNLDSIAALKENLRVQDSLIAGPGAWVGDGFEVVIANPPWEKLKLSRHEFLKLHGDERHYGAEYSPGDFDDASYAAARGSVLGYSRQLIERYAQLGTGELDVYKAFLELFVALLRPGGCLSALVPAGLLRSQGTQQLRELLFEATSELGFTVLENRARFFAIDTRFKFLALTAVTRSASGRRSSVTITHARGTADGVELFGSASLGRRALREVRPDLTAPEVKSNSEWRIFRALTARGTSWGEGNSAWRAEIVREIDMTRDRAHFREGPARDALPVIEGRMIHQHRFGAKKWVAGTGRRAQWTPLSPGRSAIAPQFWFPVRRLSKSVLGRTQRPRVGFCDITGQTNERSLLAALVPPGVVCGNKVPTLTLVDDGPTDLSRLFLWLAVANSFTFDWLLRRVITTTVNYFLLLSVPLPRLSADSLPARRLIEAARELHEMDQRQKSVDAWRVAALRATLDVDVLRAYGGGIDDLEEMLRDFPLLDRAQLPLPGEPRSTITRDFLMLRACDQLREPSSRWRERVAEARAVGATPYVPSEFGAFDAQLEAIDA